MLANSIYFLGDYFMLGHEIQNGSKCKFVLYGPLTLQPNARYPTSSILVMHGIKDDNLGEGFTLFCPYTMALYHDNLKMHRSQSVDVLELATVLQYTFAYKKAGLKAIIVPEVLLSDPTKEEADEYSFTSYENYLKIKSDIPLYQWHRIIKAYWLGQGGLCE